jgi:peptide deformylase
MQQTIRQVGEPVLRQRARPLSVEEIRSAPIQQLIDLMRETMREAPGVGLAAPQIGYSLQLAVVEDRAEYLEGAPPEMLAERERAPVPFHVLINPRLYIEQHASVEFFEGCLSLSDFVALVPRAIAVRVECLNERGEPVAIQARGWHARILQHEIDHLHGMLYIDRMLPRSFSTTANLGRYWQDKSTEHVRAALGMPTRGRLLA